MSSLLRDFRRASARQRCPVCGKPDWCLVSRDSESDPSKVVCARIESCRRWGDAGWLHVLHDGVRAVMAWRFRSVRVPTCDPLMAELADELAAVLHLDQFLAATSGLGVSAESLRRLGAGWLDEEDLARLGFAGSEGALGIPMKDSAGNVLGIRLRRPCGFKFAVRGGTNGLFFAHLLPERVEELLLPEGATDTATLLDLGFHAVGRPSCNGGIAHVCDLMRRLRPARVVVVADADEPGRTGAECLARQLLTLVSDVRVIEPPDGSKDMRQWRRAGARREDVLALIDHAERRRLSISVRRVGGAR